MKLWRNRHATIPIAILVFWAIVLFCAWTLPLLSRPAQKKQKTKSTDEKKQQEFREGFLSGAYPVAVDSVLLKDTYDQPEQVSLSPYTTTQTSKNYPVFPSAYCGGNNIRHWRRPGNGTCDWPELCGAIYTATEQSRGIPPRPPAWGAGRRVNYYDTCLYA